MPCVTHSKKRVLKLVPYRLLVPDTGYTPPDGAIVPPKIEFAIGIRDRESSSSLFIFSSRGYRQWVGELFPIIRTTFDRSKFFGNETIELR